MTDNVAILDLYGRPFVQVEQKKQETTEHRFYSDEQDDKNNVLSKLSKQLPSTEESIKVLLKENTSLYWSIDCPEVIKNDVNLLKFMMDLNFTNEQFSVLPESLKTNIDIFYFFVQKKYLQCHIFYTDYYPDGFILYKNKHNNSIPKTSKVTFFQITKYSIKTRNQSFYFFYDGLNVLSEILVNRKAWNDAFTKREDKLHLDFIFNKLYLKDLLKIKTALNSAWQTNNEKDNIQLLLDDVIQQKQSVWWRNLTKKPNFN